MAKLIVLDTGLRFWALTKAEDHLLIDAYLSIKRFIPNSDLRFFDFERRYFVDGLMLADKSLMMLNSVLTRKNYDALHLREGHSDSYTIMQGANKARERCSIRGLLQGLDDHDRSRVIKAKSAEVSRQAQRDAVYDARKATRLTPLEPLGMGKAAPTAMTEQLKAAMEDGRLRPDRSGAGASNIDELDEAPRVGKSTADELRGSRERRERLGLPAQAAEASAEEASASSKHRVGTVKLAMLAAVESKVVALEGELAEMRTAHVAVDALHAAVTEIEQLKQTIDADRKAHQAELHSLRNALRSFQTSVAAVALAA